MEKIITEGLPTYSEAGKVAICKLPRDPMSMFNPLVDYVGLSFEQLDTIYLAGGFGSSLNVPKAIGIGMVPDINPQKIQFLGNSCVMGSRMLSCPAFESALSIAWKMTNIELSKYPAFMNEFITALF